MTENTQETPEQPAPVAAEPTPAPAPTPVTIVRPPLRERFAGTTPTVLVFAIGTLFGALLSLGVAEWAEDDHGRGMRIEEVRGGDNMPPGFGPGMRGFDGR